ncbi:MAG: dihydroneopterin aldolase [Leptothrix sp. (in: b-proteobacteria)]
MSSFLLHPALADCRRLFLLDHEVPVRIGIHDFEQTAPQRLVFNVDLYVPLAASTPSADQLDEVLDYDFIRELIATRIAAGHIGLQETLVDELLTQLLAHPQVRAARVATHKPDVYPDCRGVGVEVFRIKA